jgi:sugar lactone lactonase YvrE
VPAANATFGGPDRRTLVITARDKVFSLPMKVRGG